MANSIWDDLEEVKVDDDFSSFDNINTTAKPKSNTNNSIWDGLEEVKDTTQSNDEFTPNFDTPQTFAEAHPFIASLPEAGKQFGVRAVKSYPEFAKGLNDLIALVGDKTGLEGLGNFGKNNAEYWQRQSDKIQIDPKYQGLEGLAGENWKSTLIPTITGSLGDQATNILTAAAGGAGGAKLAGQIGAKGLTKAGLITAGTAMPNVAQEGNYLDKIKQFQEINGRMPTIDELKQIQNVALGEKAINTALETVSDKLLFGKLFPEGTATKSVKGIIKNAGQQGFAEAGTEAMQEGVSIGAEKLLGLNDEDLSNSLKRIGESAAIGGIVGAGMAGGTSLAARPYDTQFTENQNALAPVEAAKEVSAKIINNGKVLYDSAVEGINNTAQNLGDLINQPTSFDALKELSRNGDFYNQATNIEEIAPKTVKKITENNAENNSSEVQNTIKNNNEEVIADKKPKKKSKKAVGKQEVVDKIESIAPKTAEKIEQEKDTEVYHTKDFQKGEIVRDVYTDQVYEIIEPDKRGMGEIRDVDTNEKHTLNAHNNARYQKYIPDEKEFIEKKEFKYDPKEKEYVNSENYVFSQQEVVDAYNNYIKSPTEANKEIYEDVYGKYHAEYGKIKDKFAQSDKITKLAPKTVAKLQGKNTEKVSTNQVVDTEGNAKQSISEKESINSDEKNSEIERVAKQYSELLGQDEVRDFHRTFANALVNKKADTIKTLVAHGRGFNENSKKMFTKYTGIKLPTTIKGKIETVDKWAAGELSAETSNISEKSFDNNNKVIKVSKKELYNKDGSKRFYMSDKYVSDGAIAYDRNYFNFDNNEEDFYKLGDNNKPFHRNFGNILDDYINKGKEINTAKLENPSLTKNRGNSYVMFNNGDKVVFISKSYFDKIKDFDIFAKPNANLDNLIIRNKNGDSIGILMPVLIKSSEDIKAMKKIAKPIKANKNEKVYSSTKKSKESEVSNGRSTTQANGDRSTVSEVQESANKESGGVSQEISANEVHVDKVGRGNDISNSERGISQKEKDIIEKEYKNQHELNKAIEEYINNEEYKKYDGSENIPQSIKDWLKKYTGAGGLEKQGAEGKGLLSEYYTPQNIVNKMWELTAQYINTDGAKVLEPSVGIGRFLENAPTNTNFDVVEMNPVSAKITKILYPDANVTTGEFQERFINKKNNTPIKSVTPEYDIVIGNPPYGQYSGRYKGLGEGKKFSRLEAYFINRGLDSLKENGIMTFIVPSSFLDSAITPGKLEIGSKCELVDAYRLPEKTFDTTSTGTDILVLRKTAKKANDQNLSLGKWFKSHPEKILGTVEERKNRFGKMENFVKGDKNAVDNIDTTKKEIKETVVAEKATTEKKAPKKTEQVANKKVSEKPDTIKGNVEYAEYQHDNTISEKDLETFKDTQVDGTLPFEKYKNQIDTNKNINYHEGELYNNFNYMQGDIYKKLDDLEKDKSKISKAKYEEQKKKLNSVLPEVKKVGQIAFNPTSDFIREFSLGEKDVEIWDYRTREYKTVKEQDTLDKRFKDYIDHLTSSERNNVPAWDIKNFVDGSRIRIDYHYSSYSLTDAEKKAERNRQQAEFMTKLKNTVDKTFNDFVKNELTVEEKHSLEDAWNRTFNNIYNPDYNTMPMLVKGLNSEFNGNKLVLQNVQAEGVNFLTNKGVGLLGFEVGVGKTLTGIISTVQNMQMGRCKKPLILVPKQVKDNWIREINQAFPNIEVNDVDNMSKFKGEIKDNTLTVATYEALGNIWYGDMSVEELTDIMYQAGQDTAKYSDSSIDQRESTKRGKEKAKERAANFVGQAEGGNKKLFNIQDVGFDHITIDEAHNFKNLFADAKADGQEGNTYVNITGGSTSTRAVRLFLLTQYILNNNGNRNVFMLTATPFNNSPIEVFNMLSYLAKDELDKKGLYNVYQFMENYADITSDWIVNSRNEVEYKQVVKGFKNASSLRELIKNSMLIRSAEDAGIVRPNKHTKRVTLEPSQRQLELIAAAEEEAVNGKKDEGAVLKAINQSRKATLSPDIATDNFDVSPEDFIKNSPKLDYVMKAVESMKKKDGKTSQLIYMPLGVKFLPKMKQYLVNKGIYKADEIAIIDSGVSDDKIVKITDSFNDREGKVKLIIGTNKIKEGMNLNKNSSVLYVPYMDWNPTDFVQIVGRIWRRGNRYNDVRVVVPLLKNSSDSFMFQKLNEKTDRINNIMDENNEYIDTSELNTAEEKINMISNPDKKAKMFIQVQKQKLDAKIKELQGRLETSQAYLNNLKTDERLLKSSEEKLVKLSEDIKNIDKEADKWNYEYTERQINNYKKDVATYKLSLKKIKEKIERLELDFEGKDSKEVIENDIAKVEEEIKALDKFGEKKLAEFTEQYEKERMNSKSINDLIKEFEQDTDSLYNKSDKLDSIESSFLDDIDSPDFEYKDLELEPLYKQLKKGIKGKLFWHSLPPELGQMVEDYAKNHTFRELKTNNPDKGGQHIGDKALIEINLEGIGNNPYRFVKVLAHELTHAKQNKIYLQIKGKPENTWTPEEKSYVDAYEECKRVNKERQNYYNKHKDLIEQFAESNFNSFEERVNAISQLKAVEQEILDTNDKNYEEYRNAEFETEARAEGAKYAKGYRKESRYALSGSSKTKQANNGGSKKWNLLANNRGSSSERFLSEDRPKYKSKEIEDKNGVKEAALDKVYKWNGNIGKDRFDVDNVLNSFVQLTKGLGKEYSKKYGINVTDKMVREVMPFLRERTGLPEKLNRPELKKFFDKLSGEEKARLTKLADSVSAKFDKYYKNYEVTNGVMDAEGIENHISHIWDLDDKKKALMTNYFTTSSKFAKARTIDTLVKGIDGFEIGGTLVQFKPKTLDYAEILKTSSDNLIKATHDRVLADDLKNLKFKGEPLVLASSKAPSDWVEISHPALNKSVYAGKTKDDNIILRKGTVKVHPDIAPQLSAIFEVQKPDNAFWKGYDTINGMLKQSTLGFSGFHGYALSESAASNMGLKDTISELNLKKLYNSVKNGDYEVFKNEEIAKQAIEDGVQIGTPQSDINRNQVEEALGKIPKIGKYLRGVTEVNNKILWDCLHTMYKVRAYEFLVNQNGGLEKTTKQQRRAIAQWVNDSFGGQAWELLGIKKSTVKAAGRLLLSPDWNFSTIRQTMGLFDSKTLDNIVTGKDHNFWKTVEKTAEQLGAKGTEGTNNVRGKSARAFFLRFIVYSAIAYNLINAAFRERDREEHPELYPKNMNPLDYTIWANSLPNDKLFDKVFPYVFIGRNKDGSARYLRVGKQVREVPEMLSDPINKFGGKSASIINMISQMALGISPADLPKMLTGNNENVYYNQNIWKGYGKYATRREGADLIKGMGKTAVNSAMPFVMSKALDEKHDTSAWDMFAQTSRGLTYGKTVREFGKAYRKNQKDEIQKIGNRAYQDGMKKDMIEAARKTALKKYRTDNSLRYKHSYVEAMELHDKNKVQQITNEMRKRNIPTEEQRRIYDVAYKEYMKNKTNK